MKTGRFSREMFSALKKMIRNKLAGFSAAIPNRF
jgi:hypothetical protein